MGTNYYIQIGKTCPACGNNSSEKIHIGKSSAGWYFGLRVYPEKNIKCLYDWITLFISNDIEIRDEDNIILDIKMMLLIIMDRNGSHRSEVDELLLRTNNAQVGINGLLKRNDALFPDSPGCTWDLLDYDFS